MITEAQLKKVFPKDAEELQSYLKNKNQGGRSNSKGASFENFFSIYKIASLYNSGAHKDYTLFSSQVVCFIDDLVIEKVDEKVQMHFQIKDIAELSWNAGKHPLSEDFKCQNVICRDIGVTPELCIVVSRKEVSDNLTDTLHQDLKGYTKVVLFNTDTSINNLLRSNNEFRAELEKMCAFSSSDKLDTLGTILLGAWDSVDKQQIKLGEIIEICLKQNPHYIKGLSNAISGKLHSIFISIKDFSFNIEDGFIKWKYKELDEGIIPYVIGSLDFEKWEDVIFKVPSISTFEDIELYLV